MTDPHPNVLLSIKPDHAEAIVDGEKAWEYRKTAPNAEVPYRAVLYASAPVQAAIGSCWVLYDFEAHPAFVVSKTVDETPHEALEVMSYFDGAASGHALRVVGPRRFDDPVDRETLVAADVTPAQNFRYLPDVSVFESEIDEVVV